MADLTVTAANVIASSGAKIERGTSGATVTAGQILYRDASDGLLKLADNDASAAAAAIVGIALHGAAAGQPLSYVTEDGDFTPGATIAIGTIYVASSTAGGIAPAADLGAGDYATVLFVGKSTSKAVMKLVAAGAPIA
jgi:hypothetical protein